MNWSPIWDYYLRVLPAKLPLILFSWLIYVFLAALPFYFLLLFILLTCICADFVLLGHSCGRRCVSGTFVMVFCAARTQPGTNRGDPPLSAINRWMSEGGRVGTGTSLPPISGRKKFKKKSTHAFHPQRLKVGRKVSGEHLLGNGDFFVLEHVFAGDAQTLPDKRGARSACAPPLPPVCGAVAAPVCYETREHTPALSWFYFC